MFLILYLLLWFPCVISLSFSVFAAWGFRKYPSTPAWVICFLLILGLGTFRLMFLIDVGFLIILVSSLSAILCIVQALALIGRKWFGYGIRKSWGISCLLLIPLVIWTDLRFSVLVVDENGNSVEVDTKQIKMNAESRSWGASTLHHGYGNRLKKGVVYFGFCQWVRYREKWSVWGDAVSPEGESLRQRKIESKANWGNWPLRITVDTTSP